MKFIIFAFAVFATAATAQPREPISDKQSCLWFLSDAIDDAELNGMSVNHKTRMFADVSDLERADQILSAYREIDRQKQIIAALLLDLCASYE